MGMIARSMYDLPKPRHQQGSIHQAAKRQPCHRVFIHIRKLLDLFVMLADHVLVGFGFYRVNAHILSSKYISVAITANTSTTTIDPPIMAHLSVAML
jgi:hypothetical protein